MSPKNIGVHLCSFVSCLWSMWGVCLLFYLYFSQSLNPLLFSGGESGSYPTVCGNGRIVLADEYAERGHFPACATQKPTFVSGCSLGLNVPPVCLSAQGSGTSAPAVTTGRTSVTTPWAMASTISTGCPWPTCGTASRAKAACSPGP